MLIIMPWYNNSITAFLWEHSNSYRCIGSLKVTFPRWEWSADRKCCFEAVGRHFFYFNIKKEWPNVQPCKLLWHFMFIKCALKTWRILFYIIKACQTLENSSNCSLSNSLVLNIVGIRRECHQEQFGLTLDYFKGTHLI